MLGVGKWRAGLRDLVAVWHCTMFSYRCVGVDGVAMRTCADRSQFLGW